MTTKITIEVPAQSEYDILITHSLADDIQTIDPKYRPCAIISDQIVPAGTTEIVHVHGRNRVTIYEIPHKTE